MSLQPRLWVPAQVVQETPGFYWFYFIILSQIRIWYVANVLDADLLTAIWLPPFETQGCKMRPMSGTAHLPLSVNGKCNKCSQLAFQMGNFQSVKRFWRSQFDKWRGRGRGSGSGSRILHSCNGVGRNEPLRRCLLPLYRFRRAARRHISAWNPWDHRVSYLSTAGMKNCHVILSNLKC